MDFAIEGQKYEVKVNKAVVLKYKNKNLKIHEKIIMQCCF